MAETANVRVVVSAVTEGAEQAIESVGDEMSGLADDAAVGQTGMDQLTDEFGEATAQSMILQHAMDELDDEIGDVGNSALYAQTAMDQLSDEMTETTAQSAATTGALGGLSSALSGSAAASSLLSTAFMVSLIPMVLTLSTVLAPLVATLTVLTGGALALAGAFGAIVGSGLLAFGRQRSEQNKEQLQQINRKIARLEALQQQTGALTRQQQDRLSTLKERKDKLEEEVGVMGALGGVMSELGDELVPVIAQFGDQFVPLIEAGLRAVPTLVENMVAAAGGTEEFQRALGQFGRGAMEVLPALTAFMFELAEDALPLAREFFGWLMDNGDDVWNDLMDSVVELEPEFRDLIDAFIEVGPTLLEFGTNVAEVVLPVLEDLILAADDFMQWVNDLDEGTRKWVIGLLLLGPVILKVVSVVGKLTAALGGKRALAWALGKVAGLLAGSGAASGATIYGAAILAGAGLGLLGVKALDAMGAFQKLRKEGQKLRDELGGKTTDKILAGWNLATFGGAQAFSKVGVSVVDLVQGEGDLGADERARIDETFNRGERGLAGATRPGDYPGANVTVNVDDRGNVTRNPYQWSRKAAQQMNRELRNKTGTTPSTP